VLARRQSRLSRLVLTHKPRQPRLQVEANILRQKGMVTMFELIFMGLMIYLVYTYLKETRLERQRKKFERAKREIESIGSQSKNELLSESQRANLEELGSITRDYLDKFKMEIPPRLFQVAKEHIDKWIKEINFNRLYKLYILLLNTNKKKIFNELDRFF